MSALTIVAADVHGIKPVDGQSMWDTITAPAGETITAGQYVRLHTDGTLVIGNGSSAGEALKGGIAINGGTAGVAITAVRKGLVDVGDALSALAYGADVFLSDTDGSLDTAHGTVTLIVGQVTPVWGGGPTTADKVLRVDL